MKHIRFQTAAKEKKTQYLQPIDEVIEPEHKVIHILVEKKLPGPFPSEFSRVGLNINENESNPFSSVLNTDVKPRASQLFPSNPFAFNALNDAPSTLSSGGQNPFINGKESKKKQCPFCGCFVERINGPTGHLVKKHIKNVDFGTLKNIFENSLTKIFNDLSNISPLYDEIQARMYIGQAQMDEELMAELDYFSKLNFK